MVMELLDGETLRTIIDRQAPLDSERVYSYARQILAGLKRSLSQTRKSRDSAPLRCLRVKLLIVPT